MVVELAGLLQALRDTNIGQALPQVDRERFTLGEDYINELSTLYPWLDRAIGSGLRTDENESVRTAHEYDEEHGWILFPTVRRVRANGAPINKLESLPLNEAWDMATGRGEYEGRKPDFIPIPSPSDGSTLSPSDIGYLMSKGISNYQSTRESDRQDMKRLYR